MALQDVLASIPGRGAYLAQQQFDQQQGAAGLGQLLGVANFMEQMKARQMQQALQAEQIARMRQEMALKQGVEDRRQGAMTGIGEALGQLFPGTPPQMDAADNVQTTGRPDPRAALLKHAATIDPNSAAQLALVAAGMQGRAGAKGVDPMIQRHIAAHEDLLARANEAERQGNMPLAERYREYAAKAKQVIDFEASRGERAVRDLERKEADLYDRTGARLRTQPQATPQARPAPMSGELQFPSSGYAQGPAAQRLMAEAGTDRDMSREASLRGAMGAEAAGAPAMPPKAQRDMSVASTKEANEDFIKKEYRISQDEAKTAREMNSQIEAYRALPISKKTGWGTEAKAYAAKVLEGLGMAPKEIAEYAADAQKFNSIMFRQNWSLLLQQKGVQTEGDAQRAQKVFAQLANTPEANEFIWDFAKAVNDSAIRKANFYASNYASRVRAGNAYELQPQWVEQNREYSIWNEPSMKKWQNRLRPGETEGQIRQGGQIKFLGFE